ncbi:MAG: type II toxin-antitoxin system VapC family toxin [Acetobacteraceae bacterium]|nr:type II toxin-antitoxin system VapC family toxin [Acetobacteraceae bacterium]
MIAILFEEEDAETFADAIGAADRLAIAAPTLVETSMVAEGRARPGMREKLDALLDLLAPEIVPFTAQHAAIAREAWRTYGKGNHRASLNLGDCFAYALAKARDEPLLYKGNDFAQTDVRPAI